MESTRDLVAKAIRMIEWASSNGRLENNTTLDRLREVEMPTITTLAQQQEVAWWPSLAEARRIFGDVIYLLPGEAGQLPLTDAPKQLNDWLVNTGLEPIEPGEFLSG